ncbi:MAG: tRNA lysidine(34) synthetase TilS [Hyphomicrobiaceae bacterium]
MPSASALAVDAVPDDRALPIDKTRLDQLFSRFLNHQKILLAVSGGRDSLALLVLAHAWTRDTEVPAVPKLVAVTVDHGLRTAAAAEAELVSGLCASYGIPHETVRIPDPAPATGVQAWAREVRYEALEKKAREQGCTAIATGHQADDQAETLLMRLARGSGIDGLAAMALETDRREIAILRPLLTLTRAELTGVLQNLGIAWADDPSNDDPRFERTGFARNAAALKDLGLLPEPLGLSARRLADVGRAIDWMLERVIRDFPECTEALQRGVYATFNLAGWRKLPVELQRRLLSHVLRQVSGETDAGTWLPRLDRLESLVDRIEQGDFRRQTFAGCLIEADPDALHVYREPGRQGFPVAKLEPGETALWDRRFCVGVSRDHSAPVFIRALSDPPGDDMPDISGNCSNRLPAAARAAVPAFWRNDETLLAVPQLNHSAPGYDIQTSHSWTPETGSGVWSCPPSCTERAAAGGQSGTNK